MLLSLIPVYLGLVMALEDNVATDFGDPGILLAGGVIAAVFLAVGFTVVRLRLRDKKRPAPDFISINPSQQDNDVRSAK